MCALLEYYNNINKSQIKHAIQLSIVSVDRKKYIHKSTLWPALGPHIVEKEVKSTQNTAKL